MTNLGAIVLDGQDLGDSRATKVKALVDLPDACGEARGDLVCEVDQILLLFVVNLLIFHNDHVLVLCYRAKIYVIKGQSIDVINDDVVFDVS